MTTPTGTAIVCALMALSGAIALPFDLEDNRVENYDLFKRGACPAGWTESSGRCFTFVPKSRTWAEAEMDCLGMNAHLASIHNVGEYHDVQRVIATATHDYTESWVGGSDAQQNGIWLWSDGTRFHYSNWCPGEPNNAGGQACLQINYSGSKCWDDDHCSRSKPYVCVMNPQ